MEPIIVYYYALIECYLLFYFYRSPIILHGFASSTFHSIRFLIWSVSFCILPIVTFIVIGGTRTTLIHFGVPGTCPFTDGACVTSTSLSSTKDIAKPLPHWSFFYSALFSMSIWSVYRWKCSRSGRLWAWWVRCRCHMCRDTWNYDGVQGLAISLCGHQSFWGSRCASWCTIMTIWSRISMMLSHLNKHVCIWLYV